MSHGDEGVEVPTTDLKLSRADMDALQSSVNPQDESEEFGVDLFLQILEILQSFTTM